MHLFLQSRFIRTHQADRLHFARMRHYREGYLDAVGHGEYARALAFSDSLIRTAEHHPVAGVHFTDCYKERADMFRRLHRDSEACMAYARAVKVRDSLLRLEQSKVIREKQESYSNSTGWRSTRRCLRPTTTKLPWPTFRWHCW